MFPKFLICFFSAIFSISSEAEGQFELVSNYESHSTYISFKTYEREYLKLTKECALITPRGTMALINITHCVWRKDQILMARYELDHLIYQLAGERYEKIFELAKTTSIQALSGNRSYLIDTFVRNKIYTEDDYLTLQEIKVKRFIKNKSPEI